MTFRIGVDVGGTFTDFTVLDERSQTLLWKEDTTPDDPTRAIEQGLRALADQLSMNVEGLLGQTALFVHGTTIATNAVIERTGARLGLLCTQGFRDVIYLRDGFKPERFNIHLEHPKDFVERHLRIGVRERIGPDGNVLIPLCDDDVRSAARKFAEAEVDAIAIAFLWSMLNADHEQRAAHLLHEELPGVAILCSSDVLPEIGEWERTSATVLGAYTLPRLRQYLRRFETRIRAAGFARPPLIMQINGGTASVSEILKRPVLAIASGPAAAPAAALHYASTVGSRNLICVDMGGTSFEVCVIREGQPAMSRELRIADQPVGVPAVEMHSVGAGGGSIGWVDSGGALRVGPQSAGAVPGPACYGTGGTEPTVTDASVVLGYLAPEAFLGGRRTLDADLAAAAVQTAVAQPLGLSLTAAAEGITRVVNSNMVSAIRAVSLERGIDPRGFDLVAGGGAGGLHALELARALGIRRVVIPREAGTLCAFGMTVSDVRHDHARTLHARSINITADDIEQIFADLELAARERLQGDGFDHKSIELERWVDARYPGQVHEITIRLGHEVPADQAVAEIEASFHREHQRLFTYMREDLPVEFLHWRVTGRGRLPREEIIHGRNGTPARGRAGHGTRTIFLPRGGLTQAAVYDGARMEPGDSAQGPSLLQLPTTTILLHPGDQASVAADGTFLITVANPK